MANVAYYYAYNTASGDYQWGYAYDDGTYGYYDGEYWYRTAENGGYWYYEVTSVYSGYDSYSSYSGYNYVYSYYDGETGSYDSGLYYYDYYGYATGTSGIGSGWDYAYLGNGWDYFSSYYEADYI